MGNKWAALAVSALVGAIVAAIATASLAVLMFFATLVVHAPPFMDWLFWLALVTVAVATFIVSFRDVNRWLRGVDL